jgi:Putative peptidoglycan binding domain
VMEVGLEELDHFWTRDAIFIWRDVEGVMGAGAARGRSWADEVLSRMGYSDTDPTPAVERFQRDLNLLPDGVLGSRTLIALYSAGNWPRPHLVRQP